MKRFKVSGNLSVPVTFGDAEFTITVEAADDAAAQAFVFAVLCHHEDLQVDVDITEIEEVVGAPEGECGWCRHEAECCDADAGTYFCTREEGHEGKHVACGITVHGIAESDA